MSRRPLSLLLSVLLAAPSFAGPVEAIRVETPSAVVSAPGAGAALTAPSLAASFAPAPLPAASIVAAAPSAAPAAAPAPASAALPAAAAPVPAHDPAAVPAARGPPLPSAPRSSAGVAARVADTVRSWGAPIEDIFKNHDVLLVGENHGSLDSVNTLTREMPRLAAAGVKAVGIEGLQRIQQKRVDAYISGETDELPVDALKFAAARRTEFQDLLRSARAHGVRVVALGLPHDELAAETAAAAARNTGRPERDFAGNVDDQFNRAQSRYERGYNEAVAEVYLTRRNKAMAGFILDALSTGGKAVVLIGQAHVEGLDLIPGKLLNAPGSWGTLASELAGLAVKAFSLTQTGGLFLDKDSAQMDRWARPQSYRAAVELSQGRPHYQPLGPDQGLWHAGGLSVPAASH